MMRISHFTLLTMLALASAACGGKDGSTGGGDGDGDGDGTGGGEGDGDGDGDGDTGGTPGDGDGDGDGAPSVEIDTDLDVPGFENSATATTDASGATYAWTFTSVPEGSALEDADLNNADAATVSFTPDLGGDYVLEVTITADGVETTEEVTVTPPTYDIPFVHATVSDDDGAREVAKIIKSGGEDSWEIACASSEPEVTPEGWDDDQDSFAYGAVFQRIDLPESVSDPARISTNVLTGLEEELDNGFLLFATSDTRCEGSNQPLQVDDVSQNIYSQSARFSPDGNILALIDTEYDVDDPDTSLLTVDATTGDARVLHIWPYNPDLTVYPDATWFEPGVVVWVSPEDPDGPEGDESYLAVYTQEDADASVPELLFSCDGAASPVLHNVLQIDVVDGNLYVVDRESFWPASDRQLWRMRPNASGQYSCERADGRNSQLFINHDVQEFAIDPFGENVVFSGTELASPGDFEIFLAPETDSQEPVRISPEDDAQHRSAHWALAGRQIVWSSTSYELMEDTTAATGGTTNFESPALTRIHRANSDGSNHAIIWEEDNSGSRSGSEAHLGQHFGQCGIAWRYGGSMAGLLALLGLSGALIARRRRYAV